jgi:hypothetical protein
VAAYSLDSIEQLLAAAQCPQDVFGDGDVEAAFRFLSRSCHPDLFPDATLRSRAHAAFKLLGEWKEKALGGTSPAAIVVQSKQRTYAVESHLASGDISEVYACGEFLLKVARQPRDSSAIEHEYKILCKLQQAARADSSTEFVANQVPIPVETFRIKQASGTVAVGVYQYRTGIYSLLQVAQKHPRGIDPRDMAWMFKRLLFVLGFAARQQIVHGAVLPTHLLVDPVNHGILLIGWTQAVALPGQVKAISSRFKKLYPAEVLAKHACSPATDIFMAAASVETLCPDLPPLLKNFFRACTLANPHRRPGDAWKLHEEFDRILAHLYGARAFRPFVMS